MDERFTLVKTNLYEQIADCLEELILTDEELKKEEKLPSEQTLAEKFGVSRNVIREALKILKERGLVDPKNGMGSYITKPEASNLSDVISRMVAMDNINFRNIYDVRIILETASCKRAAMNATEEELENMMDLLKQLQQREISIEERRELDFAFHVAIAESTGNPLLVFFVQAMKNIFLEMIEKGILIEGGIDDAIKRHANIMEALKAGDPNMAEVMMYDHLIFSEKNVENYYENIK